MKSQPRPPPSRTFAQTSRNTGSHDTYSLGPRRRGHKERRPLGGGRLGTKGRESVIPALILSLLEGDTGRRWECKEYLRRRECRQGVGNGGLVQKWGAHRRRVCGETSIQRGLGVGPGRPSHSATALSSRPPRLWGSSGLQSADAGGGGAVRHAPPSVAGPRGPCSHWPTRRAAWAPALR